MTGWWALIHPGRWVDAAVDMLLGEEGAAEGEPQLAADWLTGSSGEAAAATNCEQQS